jgi:hypothetical protein
MKAGRSVFVQDRSLLILGACTISGLGLPATLSLPVLISREFRGNPEFHLRLEAENHIDNLAQLLKMLEAGAFAGPYDMVLLQSMIGRETIPRLGLGERIDRPGPVGSLYRWLRRLDFTPQGHRLINHIRIRVGRRKSLQSHYEHLLQACLRQIRHSSPNARILVLGQGPPMSAIRAPFTEVCEHNRQNLFCYAQKYNFTFIDLYPVLLPYESTAVYQPDGSHYTAKGQRLVAQAIVEQIGRLIHCQSRGKCDADQ